MTKGRWVKTTTKYKLFLLLTCLSLSMTMRGRRTARFV
ncbi:MAG: hypothetical protein BJ554DRAFT_2032 [Olpidium bornovanus]|uniref:Uncharacterized protein n=1 Tax=Olpidium bornovanus TaxID=278681 RepID=A0A8H8DGM2_9FUNG|nr:MAG: hypothetical protein BJ554DRAFT_2032 [Olpidium bornovanus]